MAAVRTFLLERDGKYGRDLVFLLFFFGAIYLLYLGHLPLLDPDEGRYAEIPREMLERGDFVTPFLNYVKYFEKPPLHYWLNCLSFSLFGLNEFSARLHSALLGLAGVLAVYHSGRSLFGRREGLYGALVLGSSMGYLAQARMNIIDMTLTFCMTGTMLAFFLATRETGTRKAVLYHLFYLFAALTVLAKGLIGVVLPGGIIFSYLLLCGRWRLLREMRLATGIPLFLAVCVPWFVLVSLKNPEFPRFFFIHEHFERFLTKVHGRYQPPWYFIPVLLGGMAPWIFFLPVTLRDLWQKRDERKVFLLLWATVIFAFFSASDSKLIPYVLPVFPALSLLLGATLSEHLERPGKGVLAGYAMSAVLAAAVAAGFFLYPQLAAKARMTLEQTAPISAIFLTGCFASALVLWRKNIAAVIGIIVVMNCMAVLVATPVIFARSVEKKSTRALAGLVNRNYPQTPVASYLWYRQDLAFYTGRRVIIAGPSGELEFGRQQDNRPGWFLDEGQFFRRWNSPEQILAVVGKGNLPRFVKESRLPVKEIAVWGESVLVANR